MLPGATAVLFTVGTGDIVTWNDATIEVLDLESRERKALIEGGTRARYVDTGHIVYGRANQLLAVPFDLDTLEVTGSPLERGARSSTLPVAEPFFTRSNTRRVVRRFDGCDATVPSKQPSNIN